MDGTSTPRFPRMALARQTFDRPRVPDVVRAVDDEMARLFPPGSPRPGARIAITVGSRGIADLAAIVGAAVAVLARRGARPFIVPAMGSHGGATAEGQASLIARFGITEEAVGCPIRAAMATRSMGRTDLGLEVFIA